MKQTYSFLLCLLFLIFSSTKSHAQINIDTSYTPQQLVHNFLIGQGVIASNISYTGVPESIGYFDNGGTTNLGLDSGIVLASGDVTLIPNQTTGSAGKNINLPGNSLLQSLIPNFTTYDAVLIEFDFIPVSDTIKFRYIFGSEEYPEFVNSSYNDVFGFFITSGINPNTGTFYNNENIALIPGTTTPVTIDNVNSGSNSQYYIDNQYGSSIEYDGFTTVLTAWAKVIPCTNYHIVIGVADAGDHIYDSGVFLEAYSFSSNTIIIEKTFSSSVDTMAVEGCNDATITFRLPQTKNTNTVIPLSYAGTATAGVDYNSLPSSITIPAGQDSASITITALYDGITEPLETIDIIFQRNCTNDTVHAYIKNYDAMVTTTTPDTTLCSGPATLTTTTQNGIAPYSYNWSNGDTTNTSFINPTTTTTYTVSTTDQCNNTVVDTTVVQVSYPVITPIHDSICQGDTAILTALVPGAQTYNWSTGDTTDTIYVSPNSTTAYTVTVTDSLGCPDTDTVYAVVNPSPNVTVSPDTIICEGTTATLDAHGAADYLWSTGATSPSINVTPTSDQTYSVIGSNNFGCLDSASTTVSLNPYANASISAPKDTICRGESITLDASGGNSFLWSTGETSSSLSVSPDITKQYDVIVSNVTNGTACPDTAYHTVHVVRCNTYYTPNAFSPNGDGQNDIFKVIGQFKNVTAFELIIYDRWGKIAFKTQDYSEGWDGTGMDTGEPLPVGTYVYHISITEGTYEPITLYGSVILLR
ncbi:MAG: choice-of-anchor L domain-containing protein [Bacteroidales bacterium]